MLLRGYGTVRMRRSQRWKAYPESFGVVPAGELSKPVAPKKASRARIPHAARRPVLNPCAHHQALDPTDVQLTRKALRRRSYLQAGQIRDERA